MKKLILILLFIAFMPLALADELKIKGHIKPDPLSPGESRHYLIIEKNGNHTGRIRPDYINEDSYIIGTARKDHQKNGGSDGLRER